MKITGGFSVRSILRAILAIVLLLGSGVGDWLPASSQAHESCCCGTPASGEDSCPCPKPEGNRTPQQGACSERQTVVATQAAERKAEPGKRRIEPRPEPLSWALMKINESPSESCPQAGGRAPDLGQHLAALGTFRI
jgi:hypothetical protein